MSHAFGAICETHHVIIIDDHNCPEQGCEGGHGFTYVQCFDACPGRSNTLASDGYQYGVRFTDGSVAARWNGRTQRARAEEYLESTLASQREWIAEWGSNREPDRLTLVRRRPHGPWEECSVAGAGFEPA